ncbi:MAG: undecaprenyl-diphosphate phosphatase, partial [Planctomycetaceae bacterium]|nr:undecaprenyl-diphosphate phosphatase [Planctomycetaceae bacterium]
MLNCGRCSLETIFIFHTFYSGQFIVLQFFEVVILAIVQGITEFLPISSSGHLVLVENLIAHFGEPLTTDASDFIKLNILLHVGTLGAILIVFHRQIGALFGRNRCLILPLAVAAIPVGVFGIGIKTLFPELLKSLFVTGCGFSVTAVRLFSTIRCSVENRS